MNIKYKTFTDEIQKQADVGGVVRHGARGLRVLFGGISSTLKKTQKSLGKAYKSSQQAAKASKYRIGMEARLGISKSPIGKKVRGADIKRLAQQRARGETLTTKGMDLSQGERMELRRVLGFKKPEAKAVLRTVPKAKKTSRPTPISKSKASTQRPDVAGMSSGNGTSPTQKSLSLAAKIGLGTGAAGLSAGAAYYYTKQKQKQYKPVGHAYYR